MKPLRDWNLNHKIILHVVFISILATLFMYYFCTRTQKDIIYNLSGKKLELVASIIENSIFSAMEAGELEQVQSTLEHISSAKDIKGIRILDTQGQILRSAKDEEVGDLIDEKSRTRLAEFLLDKDRIRKPYFIQESAIQGYRAIENQESCFGCHSPEKKINGVLEVKIDYAFVIKILRKQQLRSVLISLFALAILTAVILRLFRKLINRPLFQLKEEMKKVQEGNLDIQIPPLKQDEIGSLARSFQTMVNELKDANQRIDDLYQKQMERAEHLASLGEVAAGLAHEIKNPIAGMKGALEIISQKIEETDPTKEIFTEILLQIDKIDHIIQDLLSYAKPKEMKKREVNPNICVENAIKMARPQVLDKDIHFNFNGVDKDSTACMDEDKIQEVILNLLLNSIAAIKETGEISIHLKKRTAADLEITIKDDGQGIKEEQKPQIFHPFYTTKSRGTGLGLSICKKIINSHEGSIQVESEEGRGTTFTILLPVLKPCD